MDGELGNETASYKPFYIMAGLAGDLADGPRILDRTSDRCRSHDGVALRLAVAADREAVEAIVRGAYTPYVARMGRMPGPMLDDYVALIAAGRVQVIEHEEVVRGVLVLIPEAETMLLDNIAVDPAAQGAGLGRRMLAFAEAAARAAGYGAIRLYTNEAMVENVGLYSRLGWVETHRGEEKGFRRVYFVKRLADD